MNNFIKVVGILSLSIFFFGCSSGSGGSVKTTEQAQNVPVTNSGTENAATSQGKGKITLVCEGTTFTNEGNCNYSASADCIVVTDATNPQNVFTLNLDGGLPDATKTYPLVEHASGKDNAGMSFVSFPTAGKMANWDARKNGGSITLTVDGNKITCSFSNISLEPSMVYNPESLSHPGMCSGSFTLYK